MALGSNDANGVWKYGEDDQAATISELLNKGQTSTSTAIDTLRTALNKATVAKITRTGGTFAFGNTTAPVVFDTHAIPLAGSWAVGNPTRLVLPKLGYWRVRGAAAGTGMDTNLLRAWLSRNGVEIPESRIEISGTTGKNDPFAHPEALVLVTAVTDYVELRVSSDGTTELLRDDYCMLSAEWVGTL